MRGSNAASDTRLFGVARADLPLAFGGCALAVGLTVTAGCMVAGYGGPPRINGADHLAIFTQPARLHEDRLRAQEPAITEPSSLSPPIASRREPAIDYRPTATIAPARSQNASRATIPSGDTGANYVLTRAAAGRATFRGPNGDLVVRKGGVVPGLGRVDDIVRRDGAWAVVLSSPVQSRR